MMIDYMKYRLDKIVIIYKLNQRLRFCRIHVDMAMSYILVGSDLETIHNIIGWYIINY